MVSKYSRVALWEDVLASPQSNVISGTQAKQTSFYKYCYTANHCWFSELKNCACFVFVKDKVCPLRIHISFVYCCYYYYYNEYYLFI